MMLSKLRCLLLRTVLSAITTINYIVLHYYAVQILSHDYYIQPPLHSALVAKII